MVGILAVTSNHPLVEELRPSLNKPLPKKGAALSCALVEELLPSEWQRYPSNRITPAITRPAIGSMKGHSRNRRRHKHRVLFFKRLHHPSPNNSGPGPVLFLSLTGHFHITPISTINGRPVAHTESDGPELHRMGHS